MSNAVDTNPGILKDLRSTRLWGNEEIFTIIDHENRTALIYDFERRGVNARCIVRAIDFSGCTTSEIRSRTLRFRIKSTFARLPGEDEGITFTGGGFTASVIARDNTYRIISALPDFVLPSGKKGLKTNIEFTLDPSLTSFNQIYTANRFTEAIHSSTSDSVRGTVTISEEKKAVREEDLSARRVWKTTSFPLRRDSYSSYCYGRSGKGPFSFTLSVEEKKCLLLEGNVLTVKDGIRMEKTEENGYRFTDGKETDISFRVFKVIKEKSGPFRQNRTLKYGLFEGRISSFTIEESFGCIEI